MRRAALALLAAATAGCGSVMPRIKKDPSKRIERVFLSVEVKSPIALDKQVMAWGHPGMFGPWGRYWAPGETPASFVSLTKATFNDLGYELVASTNFIPANLVLSAEILDANFAGVPMVVTHSNRRLTIRWKLRSLVDGELGAWTLTKGHISQHVFGDMALAGPFMVSITTLASNHDFTRLLKEKGGPVSWKPLVIRGIKASKAATVPEAIQSVVGVDDSGNQSSAVIISTDCQALSSYHGISNSTGPIPVQIAGKTHRATLIRANPAYDLALLRVESASCMPIPIAREEPQIGGEVYAVGNPLGLEGNVTRGIVGSRKDIDGMRFLFHDAAINPGSSGGALLDHDKALIGINVRKLVGLGIEGLSMAVPIATAEKALALKF
ncbi:MAG: trypsin-like peptidase domain-containing protein [Elusimicrobiota bacterium]|nr:trypsin-like peptidase domain-containing protein [Elusimicrobiota bacterium]